MPTNRSPFKECERNYRLSDGKMFVCCSFFLNSCGLFQKKEEEQKLHGMLCHVDALAFLGILIEIIGRDHVVA